MLDVAATVPPARVVIRLAEVHLTAGATRLVEGIDLDLCDGAPTVLMGPNGAGKTTLLRLMMGLAEPSTGRIELPPLDDGRAARRAFVFQKPVMLRRSAAANVAFALAAAGRAADADAVRPLLDRVGLAALAGRPARKLSGGEQQRLALARALALEPDLLFLDEPTASLDPAQTKVVEEIIAAIAAAGVKVVMSTHSRGQAKRLAGEIVFLVRGRVVERTAVAQFFRQPRSEPARRFLAGDLVL